MHTHCSTVEEATRAFWKASLAWKRVPGFMDGITVGGLIETLAPLRYRQIKPFVLCQQADDLTAQIVKGRVRRNKVAGKHKVVTLLPINVGQSNKSEAA